MRTTARLSFNYTTLVKRMSNLVVGVILRLVGVFPEDLLSSLNRWRFLRGRTLSTLLNGPYGVNSVLAVLDNDVSNNLLANQIIVAIEVDRLFDRHVQSGCKEHA